MELRIYVVTTKNPDKANLASLKIQLCKKFNGLTIIPNCEGLWVSNGGLYSDDVQIWVILSPTVITPKDIIPFALELANICKQEVQLFTINGQPYFINNDPCLSCTNKAKNACELCEHAEGEE